MITAALVGTGIFSKDVYSKIFRENENRVSLKTVWSRSPASAEDFAEK
jgi:predicted dehydrogenase